MDYTFEHLRTGRNSAPAMRVTEKSGAVDHLMRFDMRGPHAEAVLRLIAAAPDMLAALKRTAASLAIIEGVTQDAHLSALREYIAKAITKAEEG